MKNECAVKLKRRRKESKKFQFYFQIKALVQQPTLGPQKSGRCSKGGHFCFI
jgi:hypothetical protein